MNKRFKKILLTLLFFTTVILAGRVFAANTTTEGKISVNKVATKNVGIDGNETYGRISNVTLSVTGNGFTTTSSLDVVLVIDRSGSMNSKASSSDTQTKIKATKSSAITLATNLLANNTNGRTVVNMGIVTFGSGIIENNGASFNPIKLTSDSLTSNVSTITGMINAIPNSVGKQGDQLGSQGTNIQSGLERAKELLSDSTAKNKVVILLTDGKPTYFNYNGTRYGDGSNDTEYCVEKENKKCTKYLKPSTAANAEATAIKETDTTIYTVGFGLGNDTTTTTFLKNIATDENKAFLANNEEELLSNFNDIVKSMTKIANNVVVEDIVPVGFEVDEVSLKNAYGDAVSLRSNVDGTTTITWNIGELKVTDDPVLTYQVIAKEPYYGAMYTNSQAILTGDAISGNPSYPNGKIEEVFPMPIVPIPMVTKNDNYTAKLGNTLEINGTTGILINDSNIKLTDGNSPVVEEIVIKSATCGSVNDLIVNEDGSFTYTPDSSCYIDNDEVVFEYEIKSTVTINGEDYEVISNTSTITIDLTKDNSSVVDPIVTKTNNGGDTTTTITDSFNYTIKYNATIKDHVGSAIVTIVDELDYELDESKNNELSGGVYDSTNKTITWEIEINDVDSYKNQNNIIDIEKNITIFYKDIPTDIEKIINTVNVSTNIDEKIVEDKEEIKVIRGSLLVEYIDNKGNNLLDSITSEGLINSEFTTIADNTIIVNNNEYKLVATRVNNEEIDLTNNYSSIYKEDKTTVTYVYYMITGDIDEEQTTLTKDGTDKVTTSDSAFEYTISYESKINNYIGDAIVTITDYLPLEIDLTKEHDLNGGTYNPINKTITWTENLNNINTYTNGEYNISILKNIKVTFVGVDANERTLVNEVKSKLETSKTTNEEETKKVTELAIKGNVITHYVDTNNNTLESDVTTSDLVGNEYTTTAKKIDNYKLVDIRGEKTGKYIDGTIEVTYVYYKVEGTIVDDTITKTGTNEVEKVDDYFNYRITYKTVIKDYIGDALVTITDTLPLEIDTTREYDLDGGVYDSTNKTITWKIDVNGIDTNTNKDKVIEIVKNIKLSYKDLDPTTRELTNTVVGNIKTTVSEETTEPSNHTTTVKVTGNVIAHYIDTNNNTLSNNEEVSGLVGDTYTTVAKSIDGYKLVEVIGSKTGKYIDGTIEVTYIYYKVEGNIDNNTIIKTGTEEVTEVDSEFNYTISYNTIIKDYIGDAIVTIIDTLPLEIDTTKSYELDGGVYDSTNKTITWEIEVNDIDTNTNGDKEIKIEKNIKLSYKDLVPTTRVVVNEVVGSVKTDVKEETTEPAYKETIVNVRGNVISHYVDTNNNTLVADVNTSGLVGDSYTTSSAYIAGYELVEVKGNQTGKYIDGTIEVTYVYYRETGDIIGDTITKTGTTEIEKVDSIFSYTINYETIVRNYIGNATITITDTLPLEIDTTREYNLDGGVYDSTNKTITWIVNIDGINTNVNGDKEIKVLKNIKLSYKDLDPTTRELTNIVVGNIKTDVTEENTEPSDHTTTVRVNGNVISHYVDTNNNTIESDENSSGLVGNDYVTSSKEIVGYELVEVKGNQTGKYIDGTIEVTYIYYKETGDITNNEVEKLGSEELTSSTDLVDYTISYNTNINNYIGSAVVTIVDYLPYKLDLSLSDLDGGLYNEEDATITWTININNINTYINGIYKVDIEKNIVLSYKDIDLTTDTFTNNVEVTVNTDISEEKDDDSFDTEVNVNGTVIVYYVDEDGNILSETITLTDKVGTEYQTEALDINGYVLKTVEGEVKGLYTEEDQVVTYIYEVAGKGGDVEELPPQTGANNNIFTIITTLFVAILTLIKKCI